MCPIQSQVHPYPHQVWPCKALLPTPVLFSSLEGETDDRVAGPLADWSVLVVCSQWEDWRDTGGQEGTGVPASCWPLRSRGAVAEGHALLHLWPLLGEGSSRGSVHPRAPTVADARPPHLRLVPSTPPPIPLCIIPSLHLPTSLPSLMDTLSLVVVPFFWG